jgi:hypothetical protein
MEVSMFKSTPALFVGALALSTTATAFPGSRRDLASSWVLADSSSEMAQADTVAVLVCALDIEAAAMNPLIGRQVQYRMAQASTLQCTDDGFNMSKQVPDGLQLDFVIFEGQGAELLRKTVTDDDIVTAQMLITLAAYLEANELTDRLDLDQAAFMEDVFENSLGLQNGLTSSGELAEIYGLAQTLNEAVIREQLDEAMLDLFEDVIQESMHGIEGVLGGSIVDAFFYEGQMGPYGDFDLDGCLNYMDKDTPVSMWGNTVGSVTSEVAWAILGLPGSVIRWLLGSGSGDGEDEDEDPATDDDLNDGGMSNQDIEEATRGDAEDDDCFPPIIVVELGWVDEEDTADLFGAQMVNLQMTTLPSSHRIDFGW